MTTLAHPRAWLDRRRARPEADRWIAHGFESRYAWRVAELTSEPRRRSCARALRGVIDEVAGTKLPGPTPLRRGVLRDHIELLVEIEGRLAGGGCVAARGMLAVDALLASPDSCLHAETGDIERCLLDVLHRLEPR